MHQLEWMESEDPREQISFTLVVRKGSQSSSAYQTPAAGLESDLSLYKGGKRTEKWRGGSSYGEGWEEVRRVGKAWSLRKGQARPPAQGRSGKEENQLEKETTTRRWEVKG